MNINFQLLKEVLLQYWAKQGSKLRRTTFVFGMSVATAATAALGDRSVFCPIFFAIALLCNIITWKRLKEIYYLEELEKSLAAYNNGTRFTKKRAKNVTRFSKIFSLLGNYLASVIMLPILAMEQIQHGDILENAITGGMATTVTTGWISFLLILVGQLIMKRNPKKHPDKLKDLAEEICAQASDDKGLAQRYKADKIRRAGSLAKLSATTTAFCVGAYVFILTPVVSPILQEAKETINQNKKQQELVSADAEKESETVLSYEEVQNSDVSAEAENNELTETEAAETVSTQPVNEEEAWYNNPNSNGYNFEISQECLDAYLAYVQSDEAKKDFKKTQERKQSHNFSSGIGDSDFKYFAIAGMQKPEPFLILASRNDNTVSDELTFYTYTPSIKSVGSWGIFEQDYDLLSFAQILEVNNLYVICEERKDNALFYEETVTTYSGTGETSYINLLWTYKTQDGDFQDDMKWDGKDSNVIRSMLKNHKIAEIKWFSLDEVEKARAYFNQFTQQGALTGVAEGANRDDYYNTTLLKHMPYIAGGVFNVETDKKGNNTYIFSALSFEEAMAAYKEPSTTSIGGFKGLEASSASRYIDIYDMGDGTYKGLLRMITTNEYGSIIKITELPDEKTIADHYNSTLYDGDTVSSVAEILQRES